MDVNTLIKLLDAGFTKDDIMKLASAPAEQKAEPEVKPEVKPEPVEEVKEEPETANDRAPAIEEAITKALKPFETLYNNMAKLAGMPAIENVQPKGIDDILDSFFKGD